jgi:hypothetical protein
MNTSIDFRSWVREYNLASSEEERFTLLRKYHETILDQAKELLQKGHYLVNKEKKQEYIQQLTNNVIDNIEKIPKTKEKFINYFNECSIYSDINIENKLWYFDSLSRVPETEKNRRVVKSVFDKIFSQIRCITLNKLIQYMNSTIDGVLKKKQENTFYFTGGTQMPTDIHFFSNNEYAIWVDYNDFVFETKSFTVFGFLYAFIFALKIGKPPKLFMSSVAELIRGEHPSDVLYFEDGSYSGLQITNFWKELIFQYRKKPVREMQKPLFFHAIYSFVMDNTKLLLQDRKFDTLWKKLDTAMILLIVHANKVFESTTVFERGDTTASNGVLNELDPLTRLYVALSIDPKNVPQGRLNTALTFLEYKIPAENSVNHILLSGVLFRHLNNIPIYGHTEYDYLKNNIFYDYKGRHMMEARNEGRHPDQGKYKSIHSIMVRNSTRFLTEAIPYIYADNGKKLMKPIYNYNVIGNVSNLGKKIPWYRRIKTSTVVQETNTSVIFDNIKKTCLDILDKFDKDQAARELVSYEDVNVRKNKIPDFKNYLLESLLKIATFCQIPDNAFILLLGGTTFRYQTFYTLLIWDKYFKAKNCVPIFYQLKTDVPKHKHLHCPFAYKFLTTEDEISDYVKHDTRIKFYTSNPFFDIEVMPSVPYMHNSGISIEKLSDKRKYIKNIITQSTVAVIDRYTAHLRRDIVPLYGIKEIKNENTLLEHFGLQCFLSKILDEYDQVVLTKSGMLLPKDQLLEGWNLYEGCM